MLYILFTNILLTYFQSSAPPYTQKQYPFEPPFVRVVRPRFKKQTGFVMNGALCMELLTNDGWNPVNDIESVIVSIRSLLVVGDGRLEVAANMSKEKRKKLLKAAMSRREHENEEESGNKRRGENDEEEEGKGGRALKRKRTNENENENENEKNKSKSGEIVIEGYSSAEAKAAYSHLSSYHKKKGWSGWWAQRG